MDLPAHLPGVLCGAMHWTWPGEKTWPVFGKLPVNCPVLPHDCNIKPVFLNDISQGPFEPLVSSLGRALPSLKPSWCLKCSTGLDLAQLTAAPARSHIKSQGSYKVGGDLAPALDAPCVSRSECGSQGGLPGAATGRHWPQNRFVYLIAKS